LRELPGLRTPVVKANCTHAYYVYPLIVDVKALGVSRDKIHAALQAEGVSVGNKYQNLHLLPMYQKKMAYGSKGFPWSSDIYQGNVSYLKGICPVAERLQDEQFMVLPMCMHELMDEDVDLIIASFAKVWGNLESLV
jgi:dTDP-4-amino-4,6-dideoxygalactose transaminase